MTKTEKKDFLNTIIHGNALEVLKELPDESVDCVITSPPYWQKRDYGEETNVIWGGNPECQHEWIEDEPSPTKMGREGFDDPKNEPAHVSKPKPGMVCKKCGARHEQLGLEPTPQLFVDHLIEIFKEIKRVLKPRGNVFVVIDDTYSDGGNGIPPRSLVLAPELFAIRMVYDLGFTLRNKIIWAKKVYLHKDKTTVGNGKPESVKNRLTHSWEYIFHFTKSTRYYYNLDAVRLPWKDESLPEATCGKLLAASIARLQRKINLVQKTGLPLTSNNKYFSLMNNPDANVDGASLTINYKGKFNGMGREAEKFGSPRARTQRNSKFLKSETKADSPGGRLVKLIAENREDELTLVRKAIDDVNSYLKNKLRESGLSIKRLAQITGIRETTLGHYFRTDMSGAALPSREVWNVLKPILNLDDYENHVKEEYKSVLPSPHPNGANPGDVLQINTEPLSDPHFACVDEETEILTKEGWKKWNEITLEDEIATFNILDETIHYHKPYAIYKYEYKGKLVVIENQWIAQHVTPNHRVLLKYLHRISSKPVPDKYWHYVEATNIRPYSGILIPLSGKYDGEYTIGIEKAELLGWIIGDGYIDKNRRVFIYQSKTANPDKVKRIENLLQKCNIPFSKYEHIRSYKNSNKKYNEVTFRFRAGEYRAFWQWIFEWIDPETQRPKWKLLHLKNEELQALYKGLVMADGYKRVDGREAFIQKNSYVRKWFRTLCVHLGLRTTEAKRSRISTMGTVYVTRKNYAQIHSSDFKECVREINYQGLVWCPCVPNTNFVARRKGSNGRYRIFITGNSYPSELVRFLIKVGCPEEGVVLDPFAGSGTTCAVAKEMGRKWIGIELNSNYAQNVATKRVKKARRQLALFAETKERFRERITEPQSCY